MIKYFSKLSLVLGLSSSLVTGAHAIQIDSLLKVADASNSATFIVKSTEDKRLFLNTSVEEVSVVNGELVTKEYNRMNIDEWEVEVHPARTIIDAGFEKSLRVVRTCGNDCDDSADKVFKVAFVPTPYVAEADEPQQVVQMAIGFSAVFISPGQDRPIDVRAKFSGSQVELENTGGSFVTVRLNNCVGSERGECSKIVTLLSGRKMSVPLPDMMDKDFLNLEVNTNTGRYREDYEIKKVNK